tara:strand:+ start:5527 stop:5931 length:405 start_codon:yes stop_codon:yes gene_type:complete
MNEKKNNRQKELRALNGNAHTFKYERTPNGFLMRKYRNMKSRIEGVQKAKYHLYKGKELLPKEEFYEWSKNDPEFWRRFKLWEESDYERKLSPSVDRINSEKGYSLDNMEWIDHSENSRRGHASRYGLKLKSSG